MAKVQINNVVVLDNPSPFFNPFQFEITFECSDNLEEDLEWKIIYVGSAESEDHDQVLDTVLVGPIAAGRHMFVFQAEPANTSKIPLADAVGVTVVLLTGSYRGNEFVRVGYYVNNEYTDPELRETPPGVPLFEKMTRNILATSPRVTRFKIDWDENPTSDENKAPAPPPYLASMPPLDPSQIPSVVSQSSGCVEKCLTDITMDSNSTCSTADNELKMTH
ncbi:histone chaperone asf1a-A-like [Saccoglossus kowalevskii]|uniref:Histone chaperone asf1-like n=1 Tax=Saccoglossus kowalevskii TaxID=10224 RepID=A0ABM0GYF8_SACKO|nr:PREDICTED: histone chaperone asf1-like [Saccoglossus kowalevskii]